MPTDLSPVGSEIMGWIGTIVVAGGGGAVVTFGLIKLFAEKWLNIKFEERLEGLKQQHRKEMDRATKLHQREFDALPEAWGQLNEAVRATRAIKFQYDVNIDPLSEEQLNNYLSTSPLDKFQQAEVKAAADRSKRFSDYSLLHSFGAAVTTYNNYARYLHTNGIFIESRLRDKFYEIEELILEAISEQRANFEQRQDPKGPLWKTEKLDALLEKGRSLLQALEREVQKRLWNADMNA
jgi:hypothetical protein